MYLIDKSTLDDKNIDDCIIEIDKIKKDFKDKEIVVLINKCDISIKKMDDNLVSLSALQISAKMGLNIDKLIEKYQLTCQS